MHKVVNDDPGYKKKTEPGETEEAGDSNRNLKRIVGLFTGM